MIKETIFLQEPHEKKGGNPFVPIGKRMVLYHEVQEVGCLFLNARIQILTGKGLIDGRQRSLE